MSDQISRRGVLKGATALLGGLAMAAACGDVDEPPADRSRGKLKLTMFAFLGGDLAKMPKEFAKEYMASHRNVQIDIYEQSNVVGYAKMLAQKRVSPDRPLVNLGFFNAPTSVQGIGDGMWARLDRAALPNERDIDKRFREVGGYGVGIGVDQFGLLYNRKKIERRPASWSALWDPANRGKLCLFQNPWYAVLMAARLNGGGLDNMEPGWRLWQRNAKQIRLMVESNPQYLNVLSSGTAPLTAYFAGTGQQWINSGAPLEYVVPTEGAIPLPVYLQVVAGSTQSQLEAAHEIINEMISSRWSSRWAEVSVETPANTKAKLPPKLAGLPAFAPRTAAGFIDVDYTIVGRNNAQWQKRWDTDIASRI